MDGGRRKGRGFGVEGEYSAPFLGKRGVDGEVVGRFVFGKDFSAFGDLESGEASLGTRFLGRKGLEDASSEATSESVIVGCLSSEGYLTWILLLSYGNLYLFYGEDAFLWLTNLLLYFLFLFLLFWLLCTVAHEITSEQTPQAFSLYMLSHLISILLLHTFPPIHYNFLKQLPPLRLLSLLRWGACLLFILGLDSATALRFWEVSDDKNAVFASLHL